MKGKRRSELQRAARKAARLLAELEKKVEARDERKNNAHVRVKLEGRQDDYEEKGG